MADAENTTPGELAQKDFVSVGSLKNYATATASLTLVINVVLYMYSAIKGGRVMPLSLLIPVALLLTTAYILSFFKRDNGLSKAQYIWITGLNSLMLFTSISGVNSMLDTARQTFLAKNQTTTVPGVQEASVGSFFRHIFFPTHGWFNKSEVDEQERKRVIQQSINTLDSTQKLIDTLIKEKKENNIKIELLANELDSAKLRYGNIYQQFIKTETFLNQIKPVIDQGAFQPNIKTQYMSLWGTIGSGKKDVLFQQQQLLLLKPEPYDNMHELENQQIRLLKQREQLVRLQ